MFQHQSYISWVSLKIFWKRTYKETKRKRKISEKRQFFQERFFQRKFSFPWENSLFPYFSLIIVGEELSNTKMEASDVLELWEWLKKVEKALEVDKKWKREFSLKKNLFWRISLFFWDFSLSLEIFLFFSRYLSLSYFSLEINWNEIHL